MKKMSLALSAVMLLGLAEQANAQIKDVTLTASPMVGYTWWNKNLNLGESPFWGARVGFAFGPIFEIRANYEKSFDLKGKLQSSGWSVISNLGNNLEGSKVDLERIGGELKVNLWSGTTFTPYLTAGAGVMKLKYQDLQAYKEEQLYAALGAGLKINFNKRFVFSLEAKNTLFNVNENNRYLAPTAKPNETLQNWGAQASLDLYLGGRKQTPDEVGRAYRAMYNDGFKGMKFVFEPGVAYLNFHKNSLFHDQWLVGGSLGVDFSSLVGLRGFYYGATKEPNKLSLKTTGDLKMYGANLVARLNQPRGVTPYLTLGAGYLKVKKDRYEDTQGTHLAKSGWFALGGVGLEFPLYREFVIFANANAMLNEQENPTASQLFEPSQVQINMMYQAGLRFNFGRRSRGGQQLYQDYAERLRLTERDANMKALNELRAKYEDKIADYDTQISDLTERLAAAEEAGNNAEVVKLAEEASKVANEQTKTALALAKTEEAIVKEETRPQERQNYLPESRQVVMTRAQLEELVNRVVEQSQAKQNESKSSDLNTLSDLDKILLYSVLGNNAYRLPQVNASAQPLASTTPATAVAPATQSPEVSKVLERTEELVRKVESLEKKVKDSQETIVRQQLLNTLTNNNNGSQPIQIIEMGTASTGETAGVSGSTKREVKVHTIDENTGVKSRVYDIDEDSFLRYRHTDVMAGLSMGDATTWNLTVRPNWQLGKSSFVWAPEFFYGFGSQSAWGLSGNLKYNLSLGESLPVVPYAGLGLGYTRIAGEGRFGLNVMLGASLKNVLGGQLFADYSLRPHFKNHQFSIGYSLKF